MARKFSKKRTSRSAVFDSCASVMERLEVRRLFASINWSSAVSGNFNNPANWDTGTVPGLTDDVTIAVGTGVTVTISDAEIVHSLVTSTPVVISSTTAGAASLSVEGGDLLVNSTTLRIGSADAVSSGRLIFDGSQNLGGSGDVLFAGTAGNPNEIAIQDIVSSPANLNISNLLVHGSTGTIDALSDDASITDASDIEADGTGTIKIVGSATGGFFNSSVFGTTSGVLDIEGNWSSISGGTGAIQASQQGTLILGGTFASSAVNTLSHPSGTVLINGSMTLDEDLSLNSNTGSINLNGGAIIAGSESNTINVANNSSVVLTPAGGTLDGIALGGGSPIDGTNGTVTIKNGLNMNSTTLPLGGAAMFAGSQGIGGNGTFLLANNAVIGSQGDGGSNPASLTINNGITIQGSSGTIAGMNAGDTIFNSGTISATTSGGVINLHGGGGGGTFNSSGTLTASPGTLNITGQWSSSSTINANTGVLNLGDQTPASSNEWVNTGFIIADSSTVNIGGKIKQSDLGSFGRVSGTVNVTGFFALPSAGSLPFDSGTGSWNLDGGQIDGKAAHINASEGSMLVLTPAGGTLSGGFSLDAGTPIDASAGSANISGGLLFNSTALKVGGTLTFKGTQAIGGTGSVSFGTGSSPGALQALGDGGANPATFTVGSGITVDGSNGTIAAMAKGDSILNNGTISSSVSGGVITLDSNGGTITNAGQIAVSPAAQLAVDQGLTVTATSVVNIGIDASGSGSVTIGGMAELDGTLNIETQAGFVPAQGTVYSIVDFNGFAGMFANLMGLTPAGAILTPTTTVAGITLTTTFGAFTGLRPTDVLLQSSNQQIAFGDTVTFTAQVDAPAGAGITPTGNLTFFANGNPIGTAIIQADESAILTTVTLPAGRLQITASFAGDTNYAPDTSLVVGELVAEPIQTIGGIDPTFGTKGLATHAVGFTTTSGVAAFNGQSIVTGTLGTSPTESFGVTRYNSDGSLDTTFGTNGVSSFTFGATSDHASAVAVLPGGQVLVAGTATTFANGAATGSQFAIAEFNPDGTLDTAFGAGTGKALFGFSTSGSISNDLLRTMVVSVTGIIYLGGSSDAGGHASDFALVALNPDGSLAGAFNGTGKELLDFAGGNDAINSLAVQKNGNIVAAGSATIGTDTHIALARFLPTGILDKRFGTLGTVTTNVRGVFDSASSVALQTNGAIVVGGLSATGLGASLSCDFVVARYTAAGRLDATFGGGPVITSFGQPSAITQIIVESNGEIIASGKTTPSLATFSPSSLDIALARYTIRGVLDTTFNGTGKTIINLSGATPTSTLSAFAQVEIQPLDTSTLGSQFDSFISSQQGVVAVTPGGEILDAGNSGSNTVEAQIITAGVDLVAAVISALPAAVPGGFKGTASISISESGTSQATGTVTIQLQFATDSQGDGAVTAQTMAQKINLRQSKSHTYKLKFLFPTGVPAANYFLLATIVDGSTLKDLNNNNNTALSTSTVNIAPPTIILNGSALAATTAFTQNKSAGVMLTLTNAGNVLGKGKIIVDLFLSTDQTTANGTQIAAVPVAIGLTPSKPHVYKLRFKLAAITPRSYTLIAVIDPSNSLGTTDHGNTTAIDPTAVTVS